MMKNKRGVASGIDWVLGVGIFILSITFIFILFKPGVAPVHNQETLLNIVQKGFEKDVSWDITEVPIFISPLYEELHGDTRIIFLSTDDGFDTSPDGSSSRQANSYGDQLRDIINEAAYPNMKLFYVLRDIDPGNPITRVEYTRDNLPREEEGDEDETLYSEEAEAICRQADARGDDEDGGDLRGRDREVLEELCEETSGGRDGNRRARSTDVGEARILYIQYEAAVSGDTPYSRIERDNELNFFINQNPIPEELGQGEDVVVPPEQIIMPAYLDSRKTKYVLTVASEPINFALPDITGWSMPPLKACYAYGREFPDPFTVSAPAWGSPELAPDDCYAVYELGARKTIGGVHLPSLLALETFESDNCDPGYECIKEKWDFPGLREFMIEIETIPEASSGERCDPEQQLCYKFPTNKPGPPANINSFVRQFNSFLLTDDGVKIPIIVRLTVW